MEMADLTVSLSVLYLPQMSSGERTLTRGELIVGENKSGKNNKMIKTKSLGRLKKRGGGAVMS